MKIWPVSSKINQPPSALYLNQQGYRAINRLVIGDLNGRLAAQSESAARVRQRVVDASGSYYETRVTADPQSGRGRFTSEVGP